MVPSSDAPDTPAWLKADEQVAWLEIVRLTMRLPALLDRDMQSDSGLTFFEYLVLAVLSETDDRSMRMSDVAELTMSSLSRLSHVVKRLERQGLVTRRRCAGVGRSSEAVLTEAGWALVQKAAPTHVSRVRHYVIDHLTPEELAGLATILHRFTPHLRPTEQDAQ